MRVAPVSWYIGSETLAVTEPREESLRFSSLFRRPQQRIRPAARRQPAIRPGKKPTRIAVTGNGLQLALTSAGDVFAGLEPAVVGIVVGVVVVRMPVAELSEAAADVCALVAVETVLSRIQMLSLHV